MNIEDFKKQFSGKTIIYVEDDDNDYQKFLESSATPLGLKVIRATNNGQSLDSALAANPDAIAIISDIMREPGNEEGLEWAKKYFGSQNAKPIVLTSHSSKYFARGLKQVAPGYLNGATHNIPFLRKGFFYPGCDGFPESLATALAVAIDSHKIADKVDAFRSDTIVKRDPLKPDGKSNAL